MKFLKLFESKYYDEFEKLKQITGVDEIEDDIKDTIQELIDDFNFFRFNNPQTLLRLNYQRKVKRTTSIGLDYYQKIVDQNDRISAAEGSYITGFMDKLTYGESLYFFKVFQFQLLSIDIKASQEDLNTMKNLKESLLIVFKRLEYLGFTPILSYQLGQSNAIINSVNSGKIEIGIDSLNTVFNELEASVKSTLEDDKIHDELWNQTELSRSHYLYIIQKIDFNKPKIDTKEVPSHLTTSFEDFIKKHRISREGQEELRQLLKTNMLKESVENKDDFEEVKEIVKDWFDSYTDESFKVYTGRVEIHPNSTCPDCKEAHNLVSGGYDYDSGKNFYECPDCEWIGTSEEIDSELEFYLVNVTQFLEGKMNSIGVQSEENSKWMLSYLNDKDINHLNYLIQPLGYSVFRWTGDKRWVHHRAWTTTILSLDNIKKCYDFLNDEFIHSDYQILIPEL
jgi:hypothetical protein